MPVSRHWMKAWGALFKGLGSLGKCVIRELRWIDECSLHGWGVTTDASANANTQKSKGNYEKWKRGIWWTDYAKEIHNMLLCKSVNYLTFSVSKGTGTPRQERVGALKSSSVPRIAKWKYSNRLLFILIFI